MKHYRIIQTGEGFIVQSRFLWIFWLNCAEPSFRSRDGYVVDDDYPDYRIYDSYNEALGAIQRLKHMFYDYKGHTIQYGYLYNEKYFIDLDSEFINYNGEKTYDRFAKSLENVKKDIDKEIREKEQKIKNKKIINIWNINV